MFHIVAHQESIDSAGAYTPITAVADQTVQTSGDIITIPDYADNLLGAYGAIEATAETSAYLDSPSMRRNALYDIWPCYGVIEPVSSDRVVLHPESPIQLAAGEGMIAYINSNPGSAAIQSVVSFLSDGSIAPVQGDMFSVRFTGGITETLGVWTNGQITLRQTLPVGNYAVVGASLFATSGAAFRLVFVGQTERPGFVTHTTVNGTDNPLQRFGGLGSWGEFHTTTPPSLDLLAMATSGTAQAGILDLMRVG